MGGILISNLTFGYTKQAPRVFRGLNLEIAENEAVGLIGANGVGKSTLLKLLVGIESGFEGSILVDGLEINQKNLIKIRKKAGYVFQDSDSQLFMNSVYEEIAFGPKNYGCSAEEVKKRVESAIQRTHIEDIVDRRVYQLSGGQKKLVAIATVLSTGADILFMDEPSAALDPKNRNNLISIINDLPGTKLIASHDLDFIYDTCEKTVILYEGNAVYTGDTGKVLKNKELLEQYGLTLPLSFRFAVK